jgi:acetyl esterase/lipase
MKAAKRSIVSSSLVGTLVLFLMSACSARNEGKTGDGGVGGMSGAGGSAEFPAMPFEPPVSGYVELNLYPGEPPNFLATAPSESVDPATGSIQDVSVPTLRRYPVDATKSNGLAFLAMPGGNYERLDMERQATALAARVGPAGISVFGLKSRVGLGSNDARRDALLDVQRALRLMRSHAAEWGFDPSRIGVVSWSAGSHLALTLAGRFDSGDPSSSDAVERTSSRPDFIAAMCVSAGSESTSPFRFTSTTPPIFMCHAEDDANAPLTLARTVEQQLVANGTLHHLEVYATGGHFAFNVGDAAATGRDWPDKYLTWLEANELIP